MASVDKSLIGKKLMDIANNQNISPEEALIKMIIISEGHLIYFNDVIPEANIELAISNYLSFISSDGFGYSVDYSKNKKNLIHPRCFGAFPKFIKKYALDKKLLSLEEAIYKITFGPARKYGIKNRGLIKKGFFADLVIFNENKINSKSDFANPFQYPEGINYVFVNGEPVVDNLVYKSKMNGKIIM